MSDKMKSHELPPEDIDIESIIAPLGEIVDATDIGTPVEKHTEEDAAKDTEQFMQEEVELASYVRRLFIEVLIETTGPTLGEKVIEVYQLGEKYSEDDSRANIDALCEYFQGCGMDECVLLASAFSNMLNLHNLSEEVAAAYENRLQRLGAAAPSPYLTTFGAIRKLMEDGTKADDIYDMLSNQTVDLVFTAHPTQAVRRSLLKIFTKIRVELDVLKRVKLSNFERIELEKRIKSLIQSAWRTDEIRRGPPTPQDEMRAGLSYVQDIIFPALPVFLRRVDSALETAGAPKLPFDRQLFNFSSWMGGDRDGNPFVTANCTRDVVLIARIAAVNLYFTEVEKLMFSLSMWRCTPELGELVKGIVDRDSERGGDKISDDRKRRNYSDFWQPIPLGQPYRVILGVVRDILYNTREELQMQLRAVSNWQPNWGMQKVASSGKVSDAPKVTDALGNKVSLKEAPTTTPSKQFSIGRSMSLEGAAGVSPSEGSALKLESDGVYYNDQELLEPLLLCYESLKGTGDQSIADEKLLDLIRQVRCFGLALVSLDVRQESERHADVMDTITTYLGYGSYHSWSEEERVKFLVKELEGRRPLIPSTMPASPEVQEALDTFRVVGEINQAFPGSLSTYVISMCTSASDVLTVVLLQRECGGRVESLCPVAPLFERLDDLNNAPAVMRTLFSIPWYQKHIAGKQQVMIGYSDSGKDAGRLAAAWALYEGQEKCTEVAKEFGVDLTLFHGRGGTVGRGGGPSHLGILSQPPGTIHGSLRVTVQGEVIEQSFGEQELCFRTMDLFTAATLMHSLSPPPVPSKEWRDVMKFMSKVSCDRYRQVVFNEPKFIEYFSQGTPSQELGPMNIGSRPAKRKAASVSVTSLRAIPWIFAWTQTRFHLPVWLGVGTALKAAVEDKKLDVLKQMYEQWPFFSVTIDMLEMVLAKADIGVTTMYERKLVKPEFHEFGIGLRRSFDLTVKQVLRLTSHSDLLDAGEGNEDEDDENTGVDVMQLLRKRIDMRASYITPLNVMQIECIQKLRLIADGKLDPNEAIKFTMPAARIILNSAGTEDLVSATRDALQITIKGIAAGMQNTG